MLFAILFEDRADADPDLRQRHMADHLAFLEAHAAAIVAAGPLFDGNAPAGGLWLVEADSAAAALALTRADPFWPAGLRASVRVLEWRRVFAEGEALIAPG